MPAFSIRRLHHENPGVCALDRGGRARPRRGNVPVDQRKRRGQLHALSAAADIRKVDREARRYGRSRQRSPYTSTRGPELPVTFYATPRAASCEDCARNRIKRACPTRRKSVQPAAARLRQFKNFERNPQVLSSWWCSLKPSGYLASEWDTPRRAGSDSAVRSPRMPASRRQTRRACAAK